MLVIYWWIWFGLCITDLFPVNASQQTEIPQPLDLELHYLKMVVKVEKLCRLVRVSSLFLRIGGVG